MKKVIEILENNKAEIVKNTLTILGDVFNCGGMFRPNCAIFFDIDTLEVSYYHFAGNQNHSENVFMVIQGHEMPSLEDLNLDNWDGVNWADYGYDERINSIIEQHVNEIHYFEN